ncbi:MAG: type II toxin-antitoxin system PrlF family antitoxin [Bradyrhizobium sp.]|jgi:antitoxin PrlF
MARSIFSLEETSTISSKGQTTVPKSVRQALGLSEGDQIAFRIDETGVTVRRANEDRDPAIASFLSFLSKDMEVRPDRLRQLPPELAEHIASLTDAVEFDPDAAIDGDVEF